MNGEIWNRGPLLLVTLAIIIIVEGGEFSELQLGSPIPVTASYMANSISNDTVSTSQSAIVSIFKNVPAAPKPPKVEVTVNDIEVYLCADKNTLLRNYFNKIQIAGLDKVWLVLGKDWSETDIANHFGIDASYLHGNYSFALLKINRLRDKNEIAGSADNIELSEEALTTIHGLNYGNTSQLTEAVRKHGSHYITSFATGNSLYQVFVYERPSYEFLKSEVDTRGLKHLSPLELRIFFSPWLAAHVGKIKTAIGHNFAEILAFTELTTPTSPFWINQSSEINSAQQYPSVEAWAAARLRTPSRIFWSASLMELHNPKHKMMLGRLWALLDDQVVLELRLDTVAPLFKDPIIRVWFDAYITERLLDLEK